MKERREKALEVLKSRQLLNVVGGGIVVVTYYTQTRSAFGDKQVIREWKVGSEIQKNPDTPFWKWEYKKVILPS